MTKAEIIQNIITPIESAGFDAYFVGGCVRDKLMNKEPHDYDICTNATPTELHTIFKHFSEQNSEPFGVTMPIVKGELVEIATLRKDITKGRHPTIVFTKDITEDAMRRDFTVNALYEKADGTVIDPTGQGIADIKANILRFVGNMNDRLNEDPLRAFRYIRFVMQKGFDVLPELLAMVRMHHTYIEDPETFYKEVSNERKLKELIGMFGGKYIQPKLMFDLMDVFGIDQVTGIKTIIEDMKGCPQNPKWHGEGAQLYVDFGDGEQLMSGDDAHIIFKSTGKEPKIGRIATMGNVYHHTLEVMNEMANQKHDYIDMFAAFLHDVGKPEAGRQDGVNPKNGFLRMKRHPAVGAPMAYDFCKKLTMTNTDSELIRDLVARHMDMHHLGVMKSDYEIMKITTLPYFDRLVLLARADDYGSHSIAFDAEQTFIDDELALPKVHKLLGKPIPKPLVDGNFLIVNGYKPGLNFKKALDVAMKFQIDQGMTDKNLILSNIKQILKGN